MTSPGLMEVLPEELLLRCLKFLPSLGCHFQLTTSCKALQAVAKDDVLWSVRLARDFPLASRQKPPGTLHRTYRCLAKAMLGRKGRCRQGVGPAALTGSAADCQTDFDEFAVRPSAPASVHIRSLAQRFSDLNRDLDSIIVLTPHPVFLGHVPTNITFHARDGFTGELRAYRGEQTGQAENRHLPVENRSALLEAIRSRPRPAEAD